MSATERAGDVRVGDVVPEFERTDSLGGRFRLSEKRGSCVVLFFYPKDYTPGCTAQSCAFRDSFEDFTSAGATVVGVSSDSDESHKGFAGKHRLPFTLISDADGSLRSLLGVPKTLWLFPGRVTYVIGPDGVLRHVFNSQINIGGHIKTALEVVRSLSERGGAAGGGVKK